MAVLLAVAPSAVWIALNRSVWSFDPSWYGEVSADLFVALRQNPGEWVNAMTLAFGIKAPGIAWIGQFFVPLGALVGSIDVALLAFVLLTQLGTLWLLFVSLRKLTLGSTELALPGVLAVAAAPLFVGLTHEFFVEPLQTLAVAWFVATAAFARERSRAFTLTSLLGAATLAMLAKVSSPLYCLGPGLIALEAVLRGRVSSFPRTPRSRAALVLLALVFLATALAAARWYRANFDTLRRFAAETSSGEIAVYFGREDVFFVKAAYWLAAFQKAFFHPALLVLAAVILLAALLWRLGRRNPPLISSGLDLFAIVAAAQLLLAFGVFSLQVNEETRYLLPLAPYVGILAAWALTQLPSRWPGRALLVGMTIQWLLVYAQAFGLVPPSSSLSIWLKPVTLDAANLRDVQAAVDATCAPADHLRYNVVGVELPWFNANSLSYMVAKRQVSGPTRCYYTGLGFAEQDLTRAWNRLLDLKTNYFITLDPSRVALPDGPFNAVAAPMLDRVRQSSLFQPRPFPDHPRVLLYQMVPEAAAQGTRNR